MGAEPWMHFVPYQRDVAKAMRELQERELKAGRYYPAILPLQLELDPTLEPPGQQHPSVEAAREAAGLEGTQSILDMIEVGDSPDVGVMGPLDPELLEGIYGTTRPSREMVEENPEFLDDIPRGFGTYFVVYRGDLPSEICFAGCSSD